MVRLLQLTHKKSSLYIYIMYVYISPAALVYMSNGNCGVFKRRLCSHALLSLSLCLCVCVCVCAPARARTSMHAILCSYPTKVRKCTLGRPVLQGLTTDKMCSLVVINNYSFIKGLDYVVESTVVVVFLFFLFQ